MSVANASEMQIKKFKPKVNLRNIYSKTYPLGYSLKYIDMELCLYKDFGLFDLEFSGLNNARRKFSVNELGNIIRIYVWNKTGKSGNRTPVIIACASLDEVVEICKTINEMDELYRSGKEIPSPFNLMFETYPQYVSWRIMKSEDKWISVKLA